MTTTTIMERAANDFQEMCRHLHQVALGDVHVFNVVADMAREAITATEYFEANRQFTTFARRIEILCPDPKSHARIALKVVEQLFDDTYLEATNDEFEEWCLTGCAFQQ